MIAFLTPEQLKASHPWSRSSWPHSLRPARTGCLMRGELVIGVEDIIIIIEFTLTRLHVAGAPLASSDL